MRIGEKMSILVTGGAGFIGSHIVDRLIELGKDVIVIDNLSTGKKENLNKKAKFYKGDICSKKFIREIFEKEKEIEAIIHQAAQASVIKSLKNPELDAKVNIIGSINLLECCRKFNIDKFIYASSGGALYGNAKYFPTDEKHPIKPISPYGMSKYVAELYLKLYNELYNLNSISLRYSNVYGPRQDPYGEGGVIAIFSDKLVRNKKPTIFGSGEQTRDFIYVSDVVEANILSLTKTNLNGEFNISTGRETSVNELYKRMQKIAKKEELSAIYAEKRKGEVYRSVLDNKKAREELGWEPKVKIDEGLKLTIDYFSRKFL